MLNPPKTKHYFFLPFLESLMVLYLKIFKKIKNLTTHFSISDHIDRSRYPVLQ